MVGNEDQFKVISQNLFLPEDLRVSALLLENPLRWNTGLLQGIFRQRDVEIIENFPLTQEPVEDRLIWHYSVDGEFTVKTAYRMGMKFLERCHKGRRRHHQGGLEALSGRNYGRSTSLPR